MFWRILFFCYNHEISYWILAPFLSEAVEASRCYFFENQEWISKIYYLRIAKLLSNKILLTHFNLSEPIHKTQFNVRYPVFSLYNVYNLIYISYFEAKHGQKGEAHLLMIMIPQIQIRVADLIDLTLIYVLQSSLPLIFNSYT